MVGPSVGKRLHSLRKRIEETCLASGRRPEQVHLLAVSKLQTAELVREAHQAGQSDFAENYLQEAIGKQEQLRDLPLRWHFIGRIQSNKVKLLVGRFYAIHSIDRMAVLEALNQACVAQNLVQNIFLQFNVASESSKGGATQADLRVLIARAAECPGVRVLGLMVMPPLGVEAEAARPYFAAARKMLHELGHGVMTELSMGTSHDFTVAIAEGATWVRIGSDVFGPRPTRIAEQEPE